MFTFSGTPADEMNADWKARIAYLALIKQAIASNDEKGLWEYHFPGVGASEDRLLALEAHMGEALDPMYREFLHFGDGWRAFYQTVNLYGVDDLMGSPEFDHAVTMLNQVDDDQLKASGLSREQLLPIAATPVDLDLFVITRKSVSSPGAVVWFAGHEIDRFPNFTEYFLAMIEYNLLELRELRGTAG